MKRVQNIIENELYQRKLEKLERLEETRIFCKHNLQHLLDVARIAWIFYLEEMEDGKLEIAELSKEKEYIYAMALLHDIGRVEQYENGMDHEIASVKLAEIILPACGFLEKEIQFLCEAIDSHRNKQEFSKSNNLYGQLLYRADKASRVCYNCKAKAECNWDNDKKNKELFI